METTIIDTPVVPAAYKNSFSPLRIAGVEIKNRLVRTAHVSLFTRGGAKMI